MRSKLIAGGMQMKKAEEGSMDAERVEACSEAILACLPSDLAQSILVQEKRSRGHSPAVLHSCWLCAHTHACACACAVVRVRVRG